MLLEFSRLLLLTTVGIRIIESTFRRLVRRDKRERVWRSLEWTKFLLGLLGNVLSVEAGSLLVRPSVRGRSKRKGINDKGRQ